MIKLNDKTVRITRFPDNTFKFDLDEIELKNLNMIRWNFESMEELFTIIGIASKLEETNVFLSVPYLPNARMDKVCSEGEGFMLQYMVETLDNLGFVGIEIVDPHSQVYKKFVKKTKWIEADSAVRFAISKAISSIQVHSGSENVDFVYPDKGAKERYSAILGKESKMYGEKIRNQQTGEILSFDLIGEIPTNPILIIDDICSRGGTFNFTAKKLREKGYEGEIFLYVTHAEQTIELGGLLGENSEISKVFTTDSIIKGNPYKMEVYPLQ